MDEQTLSEFKNTLGVIAIFVLSALALLTPLRVVAQSQAQGSTTSPAAIDRAVASFTGAHIGETGGARTAVDRRLRLGVCPEPLSVEWYGTRGDSVLVRCPSGPRWKLFVAIAPSAAAVPATRSVAASPGRRVKTEPVISRGEAVAIKVRGAGFVLSRQGEALESGAVGDWIRVRPVDRTKRYSNAKPIRAQVSAPGIAIMPLP